MFWILRPSLFSSNCSFQNMDYKYIIMVKVTLEDIVKIKELARSRIVSGHHVVTFFQGE